MQTPSFTLKEMLSALFGGHSKVRADNLCSDATINKRIKDALSALDKCSSYELGFILTDNFIFNVRDYRASYEKYLEDRNISSRARSLGDVIATHNQARRVLVFNAIQKRSKQTPAWEMVDFIINEKVTPMLEKLGVDVSDLYKYDGAEILFRTNVKNEDYLSALVKFERIAALGKE